MKEKDLKLQIYDYLTLLQNQGRLYFDRLNSGEVIIVQGDSRRRVKLCRKGTADFFVIIKGFELDCFNTNRIIFLEAKGDKGKQREDQKEFQKLVEAQGAEYHIVRSLDKVIEILVECA